MRRLTTLVIVLALLGGVVGCGGGGSESYQAAMTAWESCMVQAPVGTKEPTACKHLAANACQAAKREHLKGTGTGLACEAVEGTFVVTTSQLRSALSRCLTAWNESAGAANLTAVAEGAYRSHEAAVAAYAGTETTYVTQFGTGLTDKTADIAVPPGACIVGVFGPRRGFVLTALDSDYVQQSDGSWLQADSIHPEGATELEPWAATNANVSVVSIETANGLSGGTLAAREGAQAIDLTADSLHGKDYAEALQDEKEHHGEAKPSTAECAECQPSSSQAQSLPRPVGYTPAKFAQEMQRLSQSHEEEKATAEAHEKQLESECEKASAERTYSESCVTVAAHQVEERERKKGRPRARLPAHW